jgi:hypothetical protein
MRYFAWVEPGDNDEPIEHELSESDVLEQYYPYWCEQMRKVGRAHLISPEACLEDFAVVHWAVETQR